MTGSQEARTTMRSREGVREENSVLLVDWGHQDANHGARQEWNKKIKELRSRYATTGPG